MSNQAIICDSFTRIQMGVQLLGLVNVTLMSRRSYEVVLSHFHAFHAKPFLAKL